MPKEEHEREKIGDEQRCRIAWEIAVDQAMYTCGWDTKSGKEEAFKAVGTMLGLTAEESNDISTKSSAILAEALTKDRCFDFRGVRQWVMCRSWELIEKERKRFGDAIRQAWREIKDKCRDIGADI